MLVRRARREMQVIARDLHCTPSGLPAPPPGRLSVAAEHAAAAGLEVWFAPFPCELGAAELLPLLAECADRAEHLRMAGAAVVLVAGCELSLFADGFLPGGTVLDRIARLRRRGPRVLAAFARLPGRLNGFLAQAADAAGAVRRPAHLRVRDLGAGGLGVEQVRYLTELLPVFTRAGVDAAFWFTFAGYPVPAQ